MNKKKELELDKLINFSADQNVDKHVKSLPVFQEFLKENNIKLTLEGFYLYNQYLSNERVRAKLNIWIDEHEVYARQKGMMIRTTDGFKNIVIEIEGELFDEKYHQISQLIKYNPDPKKQKLYDHLWTRMKELTKFTALEIAGLQAFMWGVKYIVMNRVKSKYDMPFICLYSARGWTQKTTFVRWLTKPLELISKRATENMFSDKFAKQEYLNNSAIVYMDELNGISNPKMVATVKMILTADYMHSRKIYSNTVEKIVKNAHFIGSSQQRVRDLFKDYTGGNRRFLEILVRTPLSKWLDVIGCKFENEDYNDKGVAVNLWRSIDLNKQPILFYNQKIKDAWEKKMKTVYKARTLVEDWFYDQYENLTVNKDWDQIGRISKKFRPKELIKLFLQWQKDNHMTVKKMNPRDFTNIIKRHLNDFFKWKSTGHNTFYWIDSLPSEYYTEDDDDTVTHHQQKQNNKKNKKDDADDINWN